MIRVGQKLYEERIKKGLTLEEVAKATKIRSSFLSAIEKGEYHTLPSSAYIQGFVKNYADFLGLPQKEIVAIFKREFNEKEFLGVLPKSFTHKDEILLSRLRLSQTATTILVIACVIIGYMLFQYRYAIINPPLVVGRPQENEEVTSPVTVVGKTDANASVSVDEFLVSVDQNGNFHKEITIFPGNNVIKIIAKNRFGRQTQIERHINVK